MVGFKGRHGFHGTPPPCSLHSKTRPTAKKLKKTLQNQVPGRRPADTPGTATAFSASKWADRLLSDFQFLPPPPTTTAASDRSTELTSLPPPPLAPPERDVSIPLHFYQALISRRQILQAACETLANPRSKREYNQGLAEDEVETIITQVPWDKVPGALCVLQEAGENEIVLQIGESLLRERLPKSFKQDVVLAMALAYVDLSRDAMALSPPDFIKGCEVLERALKLLQEEGASSLAPDLQAQIDETLEEITPRCVLELLALPLSDEYRTRREEGLQGVRNILWAVGGGGAAAVAGGFTREDFMNEAFLCMTAAEQVNLFAATPSNIPAESFEVYGVALALVAQAFVGKKPHLIQDADNLFQQLQQTKILTPGNPVSAYTPGQNSEIDFALERGLCSLLFVLENSKDDHDNDLLPGLCKLLETWLMEVVFPRFRDTKCVQFKLGDYYDDPTVLRYLERLEGVGGSPLAAAAAIARIGAEATAVLDNVKASAIQALQKVFPVDHGNENLRREDSGINNSVPVVESEEPLQNPARDDSANMAEIPKENSSDEIYEQKLITDKIKDASVKIMCGGVVVGLMTLIGLKYLPAKNNSSILRKEVGSAMASDVTNVGTI
ncbi:hypothetical protein AAG906_019384 [Vitis piasezkii]